MKRRLITDAICFVLGILVMLLTMAYIRTQPKDLFWLCNVILLFVQADMMVFILSKYVRK